MTEDNSVKGFFGVGSSSWRSSERMWYLKGMNDPGAKEKLVLQREV